MRHRTVFGFLVPLGLALLTAFVVYRIIRTHKGNFNRVTTTSRTSGQLNKLIRTVVDAETGQRGFAITGDEAFLEPYYPSATEFGVTLSELRRALPDDPSSETLSEIDTLFERWHREVAEVVIGSREKAPVDLDGALRGASTAFMGARAAAQVESYKRARSDLRRQSAAPDAAQRLDDTLLQLAADAEVAEAKVTATIKAGTGNRLNDAIRVRVDELSGGVNGTLERTLAARRRRAADAVGSLCGAALRPDGQLADYRGRRSGSLTAPFASSRRASSSAASIWPKTTSCAPWPRTSTRWRRG